MLYNNNSKGITSLVIVTDYPFNVHNNDNKPQEQAQQDLEEV